MDRALFWRVAATQAIVVAIPMVILVLTVDREFFEDNGIWVGPLAWILASVVTALITKISTVAAVFAAVAGGVCAGVVTAGGAPHIIALPVAIGVFGACVSSYETAMLEYDAEAERERRAAAKAARRDRWNRIRRRQRDTTSA
jgi:hypothetical protein